MGDCVGSGTNLTWGTGGGEGKKVAVTGQWKSSFSKGGNMGCFHVEKASGGEKEKGTAHLGWEEV